ncbi:fatty acid cis/trans isomerase, partial [Ideonella sp.]|uniref:fatty acid cis/trans isomerase n=1 Tax=Ideonella sp. TaxID=1929293 RepID=UPI003BB77034
DAPCQLKLSRWDGIVRGSTQAALHETLRLTEAPTTRLGLDASLPSEWRARGFSPVLNERKATPDNALAASILYRSLALKEAHPLPAGPVLGAEFDFSLDRANACPKLADYDAFERQQPLAGMPYGLPGLAPQEMGVIRRWLQAGAPVAPAQPLPAAVARQVADWERFLNGVPRKEQLMSRYLYEHLFLGHLVLEGDAQRHVFRLVRSATPPGQPVQVIATRRPYDNPGVARIHYRLVEDKETLLAKTHMPYVLSAQRMARWRSWFLEQAYAVDELPSYAIDRASNPFVTFEAIPLDSRYRFLLDDAGYFVMNFIKGPVCRGQTALDVINDRFWVFFIDPAVGADEAAEQLLARQAEELRLPAAEGSTAGLLSWRQMAASEDRILASKSAAMNRRFGGEQRADLSLIWRGDGHNPNAALTVFRHFDSATVVQGLVGDPPKNAWVMGYPLLERIYYLLVAGYDVYGNTAHQLQTRLYMDYLRMEGEANLLMLLPRAARDPLRDHWYRGVGDEVKARVNGSKGRFEFESGVAYGPGEPLPQLYQQLQQRLAPVLSPRFELAREPDAALRRGLQQLAQVQGAGLALWPEAVLLRIDAPGQPPRYFSVLRDTGHLNVSTLLRESAMLAPAENKLTVVPGFVGAYPNAMLRSSVADLPALAQAVAGLKTEADYRALADRHAIRRTDPGFWAASDALMDAYQRWAPAEAGLFDYSRLENR